MKIEVGIKPKEEFNEENLDWSLPVEIDEFILNPEDVEFRWEDGSSLPYNDFRFYGAEYYYRIYVDGVPESEYDLPAKYKKYFPFN